MASSFAFRSKTEIPLSGESAVTTPDEDAARGEAGKLRKSLKLGFCRPVLKKIINT